MSKSPVFSIITPTYNRRHTLKAVYEGLIAQTFTDFEWIIIDDGSCDGTQDMVAEWEADFPITYEYKPNGGRPSAVNIGLERAKGQYVVMLDSDDVPVPEAIAFFVEEFKKTPKNVHALGVLTKSRSGEINGSELSEPSLDLSMLEAYSRNGMTGDKWLAFRNKTAKEFLYPIYDSETFVPEGIVFNRMSRNGLKTRFINRPLLIHEYFSDGLTNNFLQLKLNNPIGFIAYHKENICANEVVLTQYYLKSAANIYGTLLLCSKRPIVTAILLIIALPVGYLKGFWDRIKLNDRL